MTAFTPTAEQESALELFKTGESMVIEAGAGSGKTSTLMLLAENMRTRGQYLAFNKAIVVEASSKFPAHVACSTAHSLAFRAVGRSFAHRLNSSRMRSMDIARLLDIDSFTVHYGSQSKTLAAGFLAGHVMRAVTRFCQTADERPSRHHLPYIDGIDLPQGDGTRTYEQNNRLRDYLTPALTAAWFDLQQTNGSLPYKHDHYLKAWQLRRPRIEADVIMFDECQPPSTLVDLAGGGTIRIGDLAVGDRVVSYTKGRIMSERRGSVVLGKSVRPFDGDLVTIAAAGLQSSYTPNHLCMAKIGDAFEGRFLLYLMRKDDRWRIGVTKARHGTGPGRSTGIMGRLREERGDAAWVLDVFATRAEAESAEEVSSLTWRLPQARFGVEAFWKAWDVTFSDPAGCAAHFGRDLRYPFVGPERHYMLADRFTEVRACNLMDGMYVMDKCMALHPISVWREPYSGPVVSLTVSGPATYIADGIVTHNCQDANPVMAAIVESQRHAQLVYVGDSNQAIYEWTGAVNALAAFDTPHRAYLTQSFRFGPAIAEVANLLLGRLGAPLRLQGSPRVASVVEPLGKPDAILCRTNATSVSTVLNLKRLGRRPHVVGGGTEVVSFAKAAADLMAGRWVGHPELACFQSWEEVQDYVENDPQGNELSLLVGLVDEYGVPTILSALENMPREAHADVIVSTAHKSKGREWPRVQLAGDFQVERLDGEPISPSETRLMYVSVTRAQNVLDPGPLVALFGGEDREEVGLRAGPAAPSGTGALPALDGEQVEGGLRPDHPHGVEARPA